MELFTLAKALGADDITSPTIPFEPPSGGVTPYPTNVTGAGITLTTNVVRLKKDEKAIIKIIIDTDSNEVSSFGFKIQYNPTLFEISDSDAQASGVQISYDNAFFTEKTNKVDATGGLIELEAESEGSATITAREIAVFEVRALKDGVGEFKLLKDQSSLLDSSGENILVNVNSVVLTISNENQNTTPMPSYLNKPSFETPKTALFDSGGSFSAIMTGLILIASGYYLYKKRKDYDLQR